MPDASGVLLLAGATCSGKTELALELAQRFDAEIVGADSRQIYRGMPIGTAAPTRRQLALVPHHLIGILEPEERYSAARFTADALAALDSIAARGKRAIVVGGTGFYLRALAGDVQLSPAYDETLRARLTREARMHAPDFLHAWLAVRDPKRAGAVASTDRYRIVRALEIALAQGDASRNDVPVGDSLRRRGICTLKVALDLPTEVLDSRIATRVDAMLAGGFVDEAEQIGPNAAAASAVGYPHVFAFLRGWMSRHELRAALIRATRRYARRQITWQRGERDATFLAAREVGPAASAALSW